MRSEEAPQTASARNRSLTRSVKRLKLLTLPEGCRICTKCLELKKVEDFPPHKRGHCGLDWNCRLCVNAAERKRRSYAKDPEKFKKAASEYRVANPDRVAASRSKWYQEVDSEKMRVWRRTSTERRYADPLKRLQDRVRWQFWAAFTGRKDGRRTFEMLGYSPDELKTHLERQFLKGMTWDNYGKWHIDHIVPVSSFDSEEVWTAFALPNLRPLWAKDNCSKGAKRQHLL